MRSIINTRLLLSGAVIATAAAFIIGATFAIFSDTETSTGNQLVAGALDLKIDNTSYYNGVLNAGTTWTLDDLTNQLFFDFTDVKPNDLGEDTISLHAENYSWVCADFTLTENNDNTCTTNELEDDPLCSEDNQNPFDGELAQNIEFAFWTDDGDNVLENDEEIIASGTADNVLDSQITLADSQTNNLGDPDGDPMIGGETHYIAKAWCFGDLTLDPLVQNNEGPESDQTPANSTGGVSCDGSLLDDSTQSDRVLADITFTAVQSRHNPAFTCEPVEFACEPADAIFASSFDANDQGLRKNGTAVLVSRIDPSSAFGAPQSTGIPVDPAVPLGSFFSLGFPLGGNTASIVYGFAEPFFNGPGDDLQVFEVTGATTPPYPDESVQVEVGPTSAGPWTLVAAGAIRDEFIDISPVVSAQFVRLTDVTNIIPFEPEADAYDVDAIKAFCTEEN